MLDDVASPDERAPREVACTVGVRFPLHSPELFEQLMPRRRRTSLPKPNPRSNGPAVLRIVGPIHAPTPDGADPPNTMSSMREDVCAAMPIATPADAERVYVLKLARTGMPPDDIAYLMETDAETIAKMIADA